MAPVGRSRAERNLSPTLMVQSEIQLLHDHTATQTVTQSNPAAQPPGSAAACLCTTKEDERRVGTAWPGQIYRSLNPPRNTTSATVTIKKTALTTALSRKNARLIQSRLRRRAIQCSSTRQPRIIIQPRR